MRDFKNIVSNKARLGAMKAAGKSLEQSDNPAEVERECARDSSSIEERIPPSLLDPCMESLQFANEVGEKTEQQLPEMKVQFGGGGNYGFFALFQVDPPKALRVTL